MRHNPSNVVSALWLLVASMSVPVNAWAATTMVNAPPGPHPRIPGMPFGLWGASLTLLALVGYLANPRKLVAGRKMSIPVLLFEDPLSLATFVWHVATMGGLLVTTFAGAQWGDHGAHQAFAIAACAIPPLAAAVAFVRAPLIAFTAGR